ncbi:MAG: hypothetical protein AAGE85_07920, partial [Pseudomonadota bacterium]
MTTIEQRKRPFVLGGFALIIWGQAFVLPILFFMFLLAPSDSPVSVSGVDVPMGEIRFQALSTMLIWFVFAAYVGPGLWRGKPKARHVAFAVYVAIPLVFIVASQEWNDIAWMVVCDLIVGGYLYAAPGVR